MPVQLSASSHSPAAERQMVLEDEKPSAGHVELVPVHVSATSHSLTAARHTVPALPAGCWHATLVPSHWSFVQGLPSLVHAVPAAFFASAGQLGPVLVQFSARSHSSAAARQTVAAEAKPSAGQLFVTPSQLSATSQTSVAGRQTVPAGVFASAGQVVLVPEQVSCGSQTPPEARQTTPALPAGCWQATLVPSHWSSVQGLPSLEHAVPADFFASAGQLGPFPGQLSARSHSSAATRQTVLEDAKPSAGQVALEPEQVSATSQRSAAARQVIPAVLNVQLDVQHEAVVPLAAP